MEVFPAHLDRTFVKIIKIITVFGFPILGPILGPIWAMAGTGSGLGPGQGPVLTEFTGERTNAISLQCDNK